MRALVIRILCASHRRRRARFAGLAFFLCLVPAYSATAQRYQTQVLTETDGLPSSSVLDVEQDKRGRLWILTSGDLTIYDGQRFSPARAIDHAPSGPLTAIARSARGELAVLGTGPRPLVARRALGGTWTSLKPPRMSPDSRRLLALSDGSAEVVVAPTEAGGAAWDGSRWREIIVDQGNTITALLPHGDNIFVGTTRGLFRLDADFSLAPHPAQTPIEDPILALSTAESGGVWLLTEQWLGRLEGETSRRILEERLPTIHAPETASVLDDGFGGIFFGSGRAMFQLDLASRRLRSIGVAEGLAAEGAVDLLRDREGGIWLASGRGLTRIASQRFLSYGPAQGLLQSEVTAAVIIPGTEGEQWVLGHNAGFTLLDDDGARTVALPKRTHPDGGVIRVLDLAVDSDGRVWAATSASGLMVLEVDGRIRQQGADAGIEVAHSVAIDPDGDLWVATVDALFERQGDQFVRQQVPSFGTWLRWLRFIGDEVFLSTDQGLLWRRNGREWQLATSDDPSGNRVYRVLRDRRGRVWVGTGGGLFRLEGNRLVQVGDPAQRIDRPVYFLLEDSADRLWFGTDNGVVVWDGRKRRELGVRDGLAGRETNRGAGIAGDRGRIWVGTERGLSVYQPRYDTSPPPRPVVELRHVDTAAERHGLQKPLELVATDRNLTFYFHVVTLAPELDLRLRCRLLGFETAWLDPCPSPESVRYTNLPAGDFRIQVQAQHAQGPWGQISTSAPIQLPPPLWRSSTFVAVVAVLAALLAWLLWRAFDRKRFAADHDALTGLPNRTWFFRRLARAIERSGRSPNRSSFIVLFLDLDGFKHINDSLGHLVGDQFLVAIGGRLQSTIEPHGWAARIGGDEFALLIESARRSMGVDAIIDLVREDLAVPFSIAGRELFTDVSIGVVFSNDDYQRPHQVLRDADTAMYRAKAEGRGRTKIFDRSMRSRAAARLDLETDLRRALDLGQLHLAYQPIVSSDGTSIACAEALLRWNHPVRGQMAPDSFIEIAEETGLVVPIGAWVIDETYRQIAEWRQRSPDLEHYRIHVNVSAAQLYRGDLVQCIQDAAATHGVETAALGLELTERILVRELESAARLLESLRELGVATYLDDFGRGQTSLRYLRRLPLDGLKLDRAFIADLDTDTKELEIARMVILLGQRLGLDVIAEGVETEAQLRLLEGLDCQALQGFYFHRPLSPEAMLAVLEAHREASSRT